mgnify:CR=1 FL=1
MAGAADLQDGTHLLVAHPPRCAIGPPLTAGEIARIIVAIAKSILEMDEKIYTTADDCHKGNAFQTACGHGAPPAAHRRKTDRVHCGFASDPALCKPLLIIEVELVDQPTYVKIAAILSMTASTIPIVRIYFDCMAVPLPVRSHLPEVRSPAPPPSQSC